MPGGYTFYIKIGAESVCTFSQSGILYEKHDRNRGGIVHETLEKKRKKELFYTVHPIICNDNDI